MVQIALPLYDDGDDGSVDGELPEVLPGQPDHVAQPEHGAERVALLVVGAGGEVLAVGGLQDVGAAGSVQGELDLIEEEGGRRIQNKKEEEEKE